MRASQDRIETDLYTRTATIDRLKQRAEEAERQCRQAEDRLNELGLASDREREYAHDQEELLRGQVERLGRENAGLREEVESLREEVEVKGSYESEVRGEDEGQQGQAKKEQVEDGQATAKDSTLDTSAMASPQRPTTSRNRLAPSPRHNRARSRTFADESAEQSLADDDSATALASLMDEVTQLKKTLASQDAALQEVRATLLKERSRSQDLEAEKRELESLAYGNTLQHLMGRRRRRDERGSHDGDDEGDSDEDEDTTDASSISASTSEQSSSGTSANEDEDDVPDTPSTPKASKRTTSKAERRKSSGGGLRTASGRMRRRASLTEIPESLSQELLHPANANVANDISTTSTSASTATPTESEELATLRSEIAKLKSENKGLSLYISKILNRILSMEGFERVLAADYTGPWGSVRGKRNAMAQSEWQEKQQQQSQQQVVEQVEQKKKKRTSILPVGFVGRASPANVGGDDVESDTASIKSVEKDKAQRRQSSGILGFGGAPLSSSTTSSASTTAPPAGDAAASNSIKKKAGRASVDWKSLRMPWSSSSPTSETPPPNSNLRPFALKTTGSSSSSSGPPSESTPYAASKRTQSSSSSSSTGQVSPLPGAAAAADTSLSNLSTLSSPLLSIDTSTLSAAPDADEDELERRRARSLLEMEGHKVPDHQLTPSSPRVAEASSTHGGMTSSATATGGFGAFFARVLGNAAAPAATGAGGEPQTPTMTTSSSSSTTSTPASSPQKERKVPPPPVPVVDDEADSSLTQPPSLGGSGKGSASGRVRPTRRGMSAVLAAGDEDDQDGLDEKMAKSMTGLGLGVQGGVDTSVAGDESYAMPATGKR